MTHRGRVFDGNAAHPYCKTPMQIMFNPSLMTD